MWLTAGYFDETTDEDTTGTSYTVAGFIGSQLATTVLSLRWEELLRKYDIEYFKASELNAGDGQFRKFRDEPNLPRREWKRFSDRERETFKRIKIDFTEAIVTCSDELFGIGGVVILPDLERLKAEYPNAKTLPRPYFICANLCMVEAGLEMEKQNSGIRSASNTCYLRPVFDCHEDYSGVAKLSWDTFCHKNPRSAEYLLPPYYESDKKYLMLQVADNFAFEARKLFFDMRNDREPREAMKSILNSYKMMRLAKFDYKGLKMTADAQVGIYPEEIIVERRIAAMMEAANVG